MAESPVSRLRKKPLTAALAENMNLIKEIFQWPDNQDIIFREMTVRDFKACLVYIEGISGGEKMGQMILEPCRLALDGDDPAPGDRAAFLIDSLLTVSEAEAEADTDKIVEKILDGKSALFADGCAEAVICETRSLEKRSVERTNAESVVLGAQEGFIENIRTNISLVRQMVRSPMLVTEMTSVGKELPTKAALLYLRGVADDSVVDEVRRRLKSLNVDMAPDSGQMQALMEDSNMLLIPQMLLTERPDRTAHCLSDGQIAVMVDNSPYALIAPITLFHLLHTADDMFLRWQYGLFTRVLRIVGLILSLLLPGVYISLTLYHAHLIPMDLLTSIAETRANVPFPVLVEVLIMEFSFYLINEAGTRMPSQIGSALGIVGALILGQAAVAADIISPILIIIVALTGLGNYAVPTYGVGLAIRILRLGLIFAGALLGLYGVVLLTFAYVCVLCGATSFGCPLMAPVAPWRPHNPDIVLRMPLYMQRKPLFWQARNGWLHKKPEEGAMRKWKRGGK